MDQCSDDLHYLLEKFLKFKDDNNQYFCSNYFRNLLPQQEIINILYIAKTNLKYFSEYIEIDFEDFREFIIKTDWKYHLKRNYYNDIYKTIENFDDILKNNFNNKHINFIKKTQTYKKIKKLSNIFDKIYPNVLTLDEISPYLLNLIPDLENKSLTKTYNLISNKVKDICEMWYTDNLVRRSYYSKKFKQTFYTSTKLIIENTQKQKILNMLKGDI